MAGGEPDIGINVDFDRGTLVVRDGDVTVRVPMDPEIADIVGHQLHQLAAYMRNGKPPDLHNRQAN